MKSKITQKKTSESTYVVYTSFAYCAVSVALLLNTERPLLAGLLFVVGVCAFLHHRFPRIFILRMCDWVCALTLIIVLAMNYTVTTTNVFLLICLFSFWFFSFYHYHRTQKMLMYSLSHAAWHILSAIIIYIIV